MIHLLRHHEIDPHKWDACLQQATRPLVYAQSWYLNVVCGNTWEALVEVQENGAYVSLFPLPVKSFLGQKQVYQPWFTQQLGLFLTAQSQKTEIAEYLALLPIYYKAVQYQLPWPALEPVLLPQPWQWRLRPNYELSLAPDYASLSQAYSTNLRRNLKKAHAQAPLLVRSPSIDALLKLFRQTKGPEIPELKPRHYQTLRQLHAQASKHAMGEVWEVQLNGNVLAAAFMLKNADRTTFLFGASSAEGRANGAMPLLLDFLIKEEAGTGKTFDFEGSEVPGVAKFYGSFGAQPVPYLSLSLNSNRHVLPWPLTVFISLAKRLR